jgi:ubiquitin fusion degradation protein 1
MFGFLQRGTQERRGVDTYSQVFAAYPAAFASNETSGRRIARGGQLLLPSNCLAEMSLLNLPYPLQFAIKTFKGRTCFAGVLDFDAPAGQAIFPDWMFQQLMLAPGEMVRLSTTSLPRGKLMKIRPQTRKFIELSNPKLVLEQQLQNYHVLNKGSTIALFYCGQEFLIDIMDITGLDGRSIDAVSTVNATDVQQGTELQVEFERPLDMPPSPRQEANPAPPALAAGGGTRSPPPQGVNVIQGQQGIAFSPMVFQPPSLAPPSVESKPPVPQGAPSFTPFAGSGRSLGGGRPLEGSPALSTVPTVAEKEKSFSAFAGQGRKLR